MTTMKLRALAMVVVAVILAASGAVGTSLGALTAFPLAAWPHPTVDLSATPTGWTLLIAPATSMS